jgi:hypothetical protein
MNVGFYYMANAGARLLGTFLSGLFYQWQGSKRVSGCPSCSYSGPKRVRSCSLAWRRSGSWSRRSPETPKSGGA